MFENIGKKIKSFSQFVCWFGIIISGIAGISLLVNKAYILGLAVIAAGSLAAWIGSFFTYGFGELIDKTSSIEAAIKNSSSTMSASNSVGTAFAISSVTSSIVSVKPSPKPRARL